MHSNHSFNPLSFGTQALGRVLAPAGGHSIYTTHLLSRGGNRLGSGEVRGLAPSPQQGRWRTGEGTAVWRTGSELEMQAHALTDAFLMWDSQVSHREW